MAIFSDGEDFQNLTISQESSATFTTSENTLTSEECDSFNEFISSQIEFVNVNLTGNANLTVTPDDNSGENEDEDHGRELLIKSSNKVKICEVLNLEIYYLTTLEGSDNKLIGKSYLVFGNILTLPIGDGVEFGWNIISKIKKLFTLKNMLENLINEILLRIRGLTDSQIIELQGAKLARLQSLLAESEVILDLFLSDLLSKANDYA